MATGTGGGSNVCHCLAILAMTMRLKRQPVEHGIVGEGEGAIVAAGRIGARARRLAAASQPIVA